MRRAHTGLPVTNAITDRTRCTWSTTVLTDRTEEVAQSAVYVRLMGCTMLKDEQHRVAPISKGGFEPPLTAKSAEGEDQTTQPERHEQQPPKV